MLYHFLSSLDRLILPRHAEVDQTIGREQAEADGEGLARLDGARDGRAGQNDRGQQRQLDAVRLLLRDAVAADAVLFFVSFFFLSEEMVAAGEGVRECRR